MKQEIVLPITLNFTTTKPSTNPDGQRFQSEVELLQVFVTTDKGKFEISHLLSQDQLDAIQEEILINN